MKIQCDVCGKEAADVFCTADEAALCQKCDNRVHNANKLASKHPRFSLLNPQFKESPRCDICQERQALLFCQEDRALLCRDCDGPVHKANDLTKKHNRFVLTGVKLSADSSSYQTATSSSASGSQSETEVKISVANEANIQSNSNANCSETSSNPVRDNESSLPTGEQASDSTSSISEYLMETLPGWHVEDLLDPSSHYGFCKIDEQSRHYQMKNPNAHQVFSLKSTPICYFLHQLKFKSPNEVEKVGIKMVLQSQRSGLNQSTYLDEILVNND